MRTPCTPGRSEHDFVPYRTVGDERKLLMTANLEYVIAKQPADQLISNGFLSGPYRLPEWRAKPVSDSIGEIIRIMITVYETTPRLMLGENFHKGNRPLARGILSRRSSKHQ